MCVFICVHARMYACMYVFVYYVRTYVCMFILSNFLSFIIFKRQVISDKYMCSPISSLLTGWPRPAVNGMLVIFNVGL
jgi:hypothetical protein